MMFDAMKGLSEAIAEKERQFTPKKELAADRIEELNECLMELQPGDEVVVDYYCQYESIYRQMSGQIKKIDPYWEKEHPMYRKPVSRNTEAKKVGHCGGTALKGMIEGV